MKQKNNLYTLGTALLFTAAATAFTACSDSDNEPGAQPSAVIQLNPGVGLTGWNEPDATPGTRADQNLPVAFASGGEISVFLLPLDETGQPDTGSSYIQMNRYEVAADGKLNRIAFEGVPDETSDLLNVTTAGDYAFKYNGAVNCVTDGITFRTAIAHNGDAEIVTITDNGKVELPARIAAAGVRVNARNADGTAYSGTADVVAKLKTVHVYFGGAFEEKTLNTATPAAIWGDIDPATPQVAAGTVLMELTVADKTYEVKAPRALTFAQGRLYAFTVRVGAAKIIVSSDDLGVPDFEVTPVTDLDAEVPPIVNGRKAVAVGNYWVADGTPEGNPEDAAMFHTDALAGTPAGWSLPTRAQIDEMAGCTIENGMDSYPTNPDFGKAFPGPDADFPRISEFFILDNSRCLQMYRITSVLGLCGNFSAPVSYARVRYIKAK